MLWDQAGAVRCAGYAQLVLRNKELPELRNSLKLGDGSYQQRVSKSSRHDLEAVDDLVFQGRRWNGSVGKPKLHHARDNLDLGVALD